jgi:hypothetical protein
LLGWVLRFAQDFGSGLPLALTPANRLNLTAGMARADDDNIVLFGEDLQSAPSSQHSAREAEM